MTDHPVSRRRAILISAGAVGALAFPRTAQAKADFIWQGNTLGAQGKILISGQDRETSRRIVGLALAEVERLENIFSLFRHDSELIRLNAEGWLANPSNDLRILLSRSLNYWRMTDGAFNPAIQPIWAYLARHFADNPPAVEPDDNVLKNLVANCDPGKIEVSADGIDLAPGMALSFNGIAQGYITDAVADLLRAEGLTDILVQLGELRALPGRKWRVGTPASKTAINLTDRAVATSDPAALNFSSDGRWNHILNPGSGRAVANASAVTVVSSSACTADAISTAATVSGDFAQLENRFPDCWIMADRRDRNSSSSAQDEGSFNSKVDRLRD